MECIYYKDKEGLTFKGQEHIFPAGLGGIEKLPEDYVSYDANNYFSKLENHMMHGSLIMLHRSLFGPSKRKDKKEGKRIIMVMRSENADDPSKVGLGYIREGTPYSIPQVYIQKDHMTFQAPSDGGIEELNAFIDILKNGKERIVRKLNEDIKGEDVIIGYAQKTIYAALNPANDCSDDVIKALMNKVVDVYKLNKNVKHTEGQVTSEYKLSETMGDYRVFGKIAFNVLAHIKGKDYVLDDDFDKCREWIMGKDDPDYNGILPFLDNIGSLKEIFPEQSHWCILFNVKGDLCAIVCLYSIFKRYIVLAKGRGKDIRYIDGMVCDWKNNKEYRLTDYITHWSSTDKMKQKKEEGK